MPTRQELYDRIRESSKDEVILEEMIRLGFWPATGTAPNDPADEIRRRGELQRQLDALRTEQARLGNIEAIKREMRKRRLEESRKKQKETKERRERERLARAAAWKEKKKTEILFLGRGVSGGLSETAPDLARLAKHDLPVFRTAPEIAAALGITLGTLRFLAFSRRVATLSHYVRFQMPKKTGGMRTISAPMPRLKAAQRWILDNVLERVTVDDAAHGFRKKRSIVSNAMPHVGSAVIVNLDLSDFFPTITFARTKGVFRALGYGEQAATLFALLCTEPDVTEVELDGKRYFVATGARHLPQGAPTSPAITNVLCRKLDRRIAGLATKMGFVYTRYADDLTLSAKGAGPHDVGKLLRRVRWILGKEGFAVHPKKTRVLRRGRQQEVTGVVVNERPSVDRATLRRFRALLFQLDKDGPKDKRWGGSPDVFSSVIGYASYVAMVDPARGKALLARAREVAAKHGYKPKHILPKPKPKPAARPATPAARPAQPAVAAFEAPPAGKPASQPPPRSDAPPGDPKPPDAPKKKWWKLF
jgi:retron-type reverse transcriptase